MRDGNMSKIIERGGFWDGELQQTSKDYWTMILKNKCYKYINIECVYQSHLFAKFRHFELSLL